jgi:hypothetical protein
MKIYYGFLGNKWDTIMLIPSIAIGSDKEDWGIVLMFLYWGIGISFKNDYI